MMVAVTVRHQIPAIRFAVVALCIVMSMNAVGDDTTADPIVRELREELTRLKARVETLERQLEGVERSRLEANKETPVEPVVARGAAQKAVPPPATASAAAFESSAVSVGGRLKVDAIFNSNSVGGSSGDNLADLLLIPGAIPVAGAGEADQMSLSVRNSRLWLKSYTPTERGNLASYFEVDFFASGSSGNERVSNGYTPRLRHAYGEWGSWLVGQTFTTFMNVSAYPETNDEDGPVGVINVRQPQVRWTRAWRWGEAQLALEEPESTLVDVRGMRIAPDDDRVPDIVGKLVFLGDWGQWSIAGLLREIRVDGVAGPGTDDTAVGGALGIGGRIRTYDRDNVRFMATAGNAVGRYLSFNLFESGLIDTSGHIDLHTATGGFVAYQHWWSPTWRSNLSFGAAFVDRDIAMAGLTESAYSVHANLLWSPVLKATLGLEWIHAERELEGGADGALNRLQFTTLYKF